MRNSVHDLTLREKIGQTVIMRIENIGNQEELENIQRYIHDNCIGGLYVGAGIEIAENVIKSQAVSFVNTLINESSEKSKIQPIICADLDSSGYPFLMAIGATNSLEIAYDYGKATALQARAFGIHLVFSPVVDLTNFMPMRCINNKADKAIPLLKAIVNGMRDHGLATHVKHFPGIGEKVNPDEWFSRHSKLINSHLATARNDMSRDEWYESQGKVYRQLLLECIDTVMTAHDSFPSFQNSDKRYGKYLPATLSKELTTGLLKEELGFKGVCITDALTMGGFVGWYESRAQCEVECLKAGNDMLLWPTDEYIDAVEKAVLTGSVPVERLDEAVGRIFDLKEKYVFGHNTRAFDARYALDYKQKLSEKVSEKSTILITNEDNLVPIIKTSSILILPITENDSFMKHVTVFADVFRSRNNEVDILENYSMEDLADAVKKYDYLIYALDRFDFNDLGSSTPLVRRHTWAALTYGREKSIVVSFGSPFLYAYFELAKTFVNAFPTFGSTGASDAFRAAAKAIMGEISFEGVLPLT